MLIVYENIVGDGEVIVTTPALEKEMLKAYFKKGGRKKGHYDRTTWADCSAVAINPRMHIS